MVVYSAYYTEMYVRRAFALGAMAFVEKKDQLENLAKAIESARNGVASISQLDAQHQKSAQFKELSARELDVLRLTSKGLSNAQIGDALNIRESTVKSYMKRIFFKLDAQSRQHAASIAVDRGLIIPK